MNEDENDDPAAEFDRDIEAELPESVDRAAIRRMRFVANVLDESIPVPGTNYRIGVDPIVGLVPGAGDAITTLVSMYIVVESARLGVSYTTVAKMLANVTIDAAGGSLPFVGEVFDAAWKANTRNVELALDDLARSPPDSTDVTHVEIE